MISLSGMKELLKIYLLTGMTGKLIREPEQHGESVTERLHSITISIIWLQDLLKMTHSAVTWLEKDNYQGKMPSF